MSLTTALYNQGIDQTGQLKDAAWVNDPGNATETSIFLPRVVQDDIGPGKLRRNFPYACTANLGLCRPYEGPEVMLSGVCAMPMLSNRLLEPSGGPGSARIITENGPVRLPENFAEACQMFLENPPPLTLPNLLKAGGISPQRTILLAETSFYTDFTLNKLIRNCQVPPSSTMAAGVRRQLQEFFTKRYQFAFNAFSRMRDLVLAADSGVMPLMQVSDNDPVFAPLYEEQIRRYAMDRELTTRNKAAIQVAGYYSSAIVNAYRQANLLSADTRAIIYEGLSNVVVPRTAAVFNVDRRAAFCAQVEREAFWGDRDGQALDNSIPGLITVPAPRGRLGTLRAEAADSLDPYLVPNSRNRASFDWKAFCAGEAQSPDINQNTGLAITLLAPSTPQVVSLQELIVAQCQRNQLTPDERRGRKLELEKLTEAVVVEVTRIQNIIFQEEG